MLLPTSLLLKPALASPQAHRLVSIQTSQWWNLNQTRASLQHHQLHRLLCPLLPNHPNSSKRQASSPLTRCKRPLHSNQLLLRLSCQQHQPSRACPCPSLLG
jgi:hypothetical protein